MFVHSKRLRDNAEATQAGKMARGSVTVVPELGLATGADQLGGRSLRKRIVVAVVMLALGCAAVALASASASGDSKLRDTSVLKVGVSDRLDVWRQYQNDEDINPRKKKGAKADWEKQRSIPDFVDGIIGPSPTSMDEGGSKSRGSFNVKKITDKTDFYYLRISDRSGNADRIRAELVGSDGYRLDWVGFGEIFTGPIHEGNLGETDYLRVEVRPMPLVSFSFILLNCAHFFFCFFFRNHQVFNFLDAIKNHVLFISCISHRIAFPIVMPRLLGPDHWRGAVLPLQVLNNCHARDACSYERTSLAHPKATHSNHP